METDLTRKIKRYLSRYYPTRFSGIEVNQFRNRHIGFEVLVETGNTKGGIVDCLRADEYFSDVVETHYCRYYGKKSILDYYIKNHCELGYRSVTEVPNLCDKKGCIGHRVGKSGVENILLTAFEIKITKSDFKSKNGHNFCGNLNYYVIPKELKVELLPLIPEQIGLIIYDKENCQLRQVKRAIYKEKTDTEKMWLLLNLMKSNYSKNAFGGV